MEVMFENIDVSDRIIVMTEKAFAFPANMPIVPGHILACPKRIVKTFEDLEDAEVKALFDLISDLKIALKKTFKAKGFNIAWNEGELAGQTVSHLHVHIVPRILEDKGIVEYEPRRFLYRPGIRSNSPIEELKSVAKEIAKNLFKH